MLKISRALALAGALSLALTVPVGAQLYPSGSVQGNATASAAPPRASDIRAVLHRALGCSDSQIVGIAGGTVACAALGTIDTLTIGEKLRLNNAVTATQITANQNDYTGTDGSTTCTTKKTIRISSDAARNISGLSCSQTDGDVVVVYNAGSFLITLEDEDTDSLAANRFGFGANLFLAAKQGAALIYDGTASRYRQIGGPASGSGSVASEALSQNFLATTHFTPGSTTQLTLTSAPASDDSLLVTFDGVVQSHNTFTLAGAVITFAAAIPANVAVVETQWFSGIVLGGVSSIGTASGSVSCGNALDCGYSTASTLSVVTPPGGRLTLQSGRPVQTADQTARTTIYYTCTGQHMPYVPIPNGTRHLSYEIPSCEISVGLSAASIISGQVFDVFAVIVAGVPTLCADINGWTSGSRSGSTVTHGSKDIHLFRGYWTNAGTINQCATGAAGTTILNPIAADRALYLGSFLATANGQVSMTMSPEAVEGGTNTKCALTNAYNRVETTCLSKDLGTIISSERAWNSTSSGSMVACNAAGPGSGLNNRIHYVDPLGDLKAHVTYEVSVVGNNSSLGFASTVGFGLNGTDTNTSVGRIQDQVAAPAPSINFGFSQRVFLNIIPASAFTVIGHNFVQCLEGGNNNRYYGQDFSGLRLTLTN